ncbi:MAG: DUF1292 domain-containing protein [Clostridia bacterium]|nr:DUF1292 domain-containing protein [Clostridia bacterium]
MNKDEGIITLEDENGKMIDMHVVEMLEHMGIKYVLLQSADESDETSYIFRFREDVDFDRLESIDDDKELEDVLELFDKKISDYGHVN